MRTPRTVDEIADAILPASIDGIHERALCLLLAEHERDIAELRARCEPGEEGREGDPSSAAASDQRAPGSTAPAPTTEVVECDAKWLDGHWQERGRNIAMTIRALAADRDRLADEVTSLKADYRAASDRYSKELHANHLLRIERDALQRRIEAMTQREPTDDQLDTMYQLLGQPDAPQQRWREVWCYVRDTVLDTPTSEPSPEYTPPDTFGLCRHDDVNDSAREGEVWCGDCGMPNPRFLVASEPIDGPKNQRMVGFNEGPSTPVARLMPQPSPATPSAEDVEWWRQWFLAQDEIPIDYAQGLAERLSADVSKREAGLRDELAAARAKLDPERERLIAECVKAGIGPYWTECANTTGNLADYERKRRAAAEGGK